VVNVTVIRRRIEGVRESAKLPKRRASPIAGENEGVRERKKREMRRRIADCATKLFISRGFENVTLQDIAASAKTSKVTVLNYFPRKEDLFFNVGDHVLPLVREALAERGRHSPIATLRALVAQRVNQEAPIVDRSIARYWQTVSESSSLRARALELLVATEQGLGALLAASIGAPKNDRVAHLIATVLVAAWRVAFGEAIRSLRSVKAPKTPSVRVIFSETLERAFKAATAIAHETAYV
jgi:AcrR family transcriptional regulator